MNIRRAQKKDARIIANYIILAMEDILYAWIGERSMDKSIRFLEHLIRKKNTQYSYENCWLIESEKKVIASANVYDGAALKQLREPAIKLLRSMFDRELQVEDETQAGEFYIDCISVHPQWQGKGIGSKLLTCLIDEYVHKQNKVLGLLVDKDKPGAKKLYINLGFKVLGEKLLMGKSFEHLQIKK